MTYTEWRDELKNNLLSVSESERRRVLDYYAEAYADRREAGFSEHEIIEYFGAPYDAAQRILCDRSDYSDEFFDDAKSERAAEDKRKRDDEDRKKQEVEYRHKPDDEKPRDDTANKSSDKSGDKSSDGSSDIRWLYVVLCIVFAIPIFACFMALVGISVGFCVAPFAVLISGVCIIGGGVGTMVTGEVLAGLASVGLGLVVLGIGIILMSVFTKIVNLIWKLWNALFKWIKSLFGIKEKEKSR